MFRESDSDSEAEEREPIAQTQMRLLGDEDDGVHVDPELAAAIARSRDNARTEEQELAEAIELSMATVPASSTSDPDDNDLDFARAIELSMTTAPASSTLSHVDDMELAMALSRSEAEKQSSMMLAASTQTTTTAPAVNVATAASVTSISGAVLDRRKGFLAAYEQRIRLAEEQRQAAGRGAAASAKPKQ